VPDGARATPGRANDTRDLERVLEAEDARPAEGGDLETLIAAAESEDVQLRRAATRALGRLENPELIAQLSRHLADPDPIVRSAAADALAQAVHTTDGALVLDHLLARVDVEDHAAVRGALARSIGRLALEAPDQRRAAEALAALALFHEAEAPSETLVGVALGFEALLRRAGGGGLDRPAAERLEAMSTYGRDDPGDVDAGRIRALAMSALGQARRMTLERAELAQSDPDPEVRRAPLRFLNALVPAERPILVRRALDDESARVVIDALRLVASGPRNTESCAWLLAAATPSAPPPVRLVALEALARPCPDAATQREVLRTAAVALGSDASGRWQPAARALLSLAALDERAAAALLPRFSAHPSPFVRAYAATVADMLDDEATMEALAADSVPNVRTVALEALFAARGRGIDDLLLDQLGSDDPQLLMSVARLLEGAPRWAAVASALLVTLERLTEARRETWRDPRRALLERIRELGDASLAERLRPLLSDYDPVVATDAAETVTAWTGQSASAEPMLLPRAPLPPAAELRDLERTSVALHMRGGGTIVVDVLPDVAPRNAWRFVSLARSGYFDGLTFHRWAPNFVIQGGSPGANEYAGDGPYTRDEVGASHWRGTVGVSTRGRDSGDGQIFINLVDNVRLDHDYTVFGVVSEGMDVVDAVLEGAVIERAEVRVGSLTTTRLASIP
jgi:cyclophilin family peptidyl-prolyl cis-trans isomerase/HEAT repeat protein